MTISEPKCSKRNCKHFIGVKPNQNEKLPITICEAFPKGIPDEIAYGDNKHLKPIENQKNEITFEKE